MGCRQTKDEKYLESKPEHEIVEGRNTVPLVDSRLPIDAREVFKLKQSWKGIKRKIEETGVEMFIRLFKTNSNLKYIFTNLKQLETEDDMRENEALEHHATFVMTTIDEAITHIDNYDYVTEHLHTTGATHQRFSEFQSDNFKKIKDPFLEAVKLTLGDRYTDYMANVYSKSIDFILKGLKEGYLGENQSNEVQSTKSTQEKESEIHQNNGVQNVTCIPEIQINA